MDNLFPKKHILVIEDDIDIQDTFKEVLEHENYQVSTADDGQEGLSALKQNSRPNLILLDMTMPVMDGREFLDNLRSDPNIAHIPVIVVSALADIKNTAGCTAFLRKPTDLDSLVRLVIKFAL